MANAASPATAKRLFVSMQAPGHRDDLVGGHRAAGLLVDCDVVLVPDVHRDALAEAADWEALLVPLPAPDAGPAVRMKASYVEAHALNGADTAVAMVRLTQPATFPPSKVRLSGADLGSELIERRGSFAAFLPQRGAMLSTLRQDPRAVLSQVTKQVDTKGSPGTKFVVHFSPEDFAWSICKWIRCDPDPPVPTGRRRGAFEWITPR